MISEPRPLVLAGPSNEPQRSPHHWCWLYFWCNKRMTALILNASFHMWDNFSFSHPHQEVGSLVNPLITSNTSLYENVLCFRCTDGYGGRNCSIYHGQQNPCLGYCNQNGRCSLVTLGSELPNPVCSCYPGWTGLHCEERSACKAYCFNGGTCQESPDPSLKPSCM